MTRLVIAFGAALLLAGCAGQAATISTDVGVATTDAAKAASAAEALYGIAKGEAIAAAVANPGLAPKINANIAKADAAEAALVAAVSAVSAVSGDVTADTSAVISQANALQLIAAPAIKVVGS
jgi:hypothetical protein